MRFFSLLFLLLVAAWTTVATAPHTARLHLVPRQNAASPTKSETQNATKSLTKTRTSPTATGTKAHKAKQTGLTKASKIGIGVGVPLGVVAIAGAIGAYIVGKRRGRKRRVDDPTAGAGKLVKDPSAELNMSPQSQTPIVAELPTGQSNEFANERRIAPWWNPFGASGAKKNGYSVPMGAPQSPQELPA